MRAVALVCALLLPALTGCLLPSAEDDPPASNINPGDGGGTGSGGSTLLPGKHLNMSIAAGAALVEGVQVVLVLDNVGNETLSGSLVVELIDPLGQTIARTNPQQVILQPRGNARLPWNLPARLESGVYRWNATLDGVTATVTAPVTGSAAPGDGPFPLGFTPVFRLEVNTSRTTYYRGDQILIRLENRGNAPIRGALNVSVHGPAASLPQGEVHTAPRVAGESFADPQIAPGEVRVVEVTLPNAAIPAGIPQYYVWVDWRHGNSLTNFFFHNQSSKPAPLTGPVQRTWTTPSAPPGWSGKEEFTLDASLNRKATLWYAGPGDPGPQSTPAYRATIKAAMIDSWAYFKGKGWILPDRPIHIYIDNPGGVALGTMQPTDYGAHIIIGPEDLHTDKGANVRTTTAHELFHVFQTSYDFDEGFLIEGFATWIMDLPFAGSKDYISQSRAFLNAPDEKPLQYREHELALFVRWLAEKKDTAPNYPKMKQLTEQSRDYDNEQVFEKVFGAPFNTLWVQFVRDVAKENFTDAQAIFHTPNVFGLRAWRWVFDGTAGNLTNERVNCTVSLSFAGFDAQKPEICQEDVGRIRHAYGFDVYHIAPNANTNPNVALPLTLRFVPQDSESAFTAFVAVRANGQGWQIQEFGPLLNGKQEASVQNLHGRDVYVFVTRGALGNGAFDIEIA